MRQTKRQPNARSLLAKVYWACAFLVICAPRVTSATSFPQESNANARLANAAQGQEIVDNALQFEQPVPGTQDCSHLVQQIYAAAGFDYPYASSFDLYAGNENFRRVKVPQPGDLITWPGHVGIVLNPAEHSFYSLVRSGLQTEDYNARYWRSRGRARFYRYMVEGSATVETAKSVPQPSHRPGSAAKRDKTSVRATRQQ